MFSTLRKLADLTERLEALEKAFKAVKTASPEGLRERQSALESQLDAHVTAMRSELGRIWLKFRDASGRDAPPARGGIPDDDEFQALLDLQNHNGREKH